MGAIRGDHTVGHVGVNISFGRQVCSTVFPHLQICQVVNHCASKRYLKIQKKDEIVEMQYRMATYEHTYIRHFVISRDVFPNNLK